MEPPYDKSLSYQAWYSAFENRRAEIIEKLKAKGLSQEDIVSYFDFENMVEKERGFCPLYASRTKCHQTDSLNCFYCGCPYFEFDEAGLSQKDGKTVYSRCRINCKQGKEAHTETAIHQDCSECLVPHRAAFVRKQIGETLKELGPSD